jgi:hypothetical protein
MNDILIKLSEYKQNFNVTKNVGPPLNPKDYNCPDSVKKTFHELNKSTVYEWGLNKITFFYNVNEIGKIVFHDKEEHCDMLFDYVSRILHVIQPKNKPITAMIILSPAEKYYPKDRIFGPDHINTGYSTDDHIVIYRKEEWFKVFIHECFHFFKYDHALFDPALKKPILNMFRVESEVNLYETWCEIWARTLNCYMASFMTGIPLSILLNREKKHSVRHMVNVLKHMGLTYENLFTTNDFHENTNVLAYVVIGAILMHHDFLLTFTKEKKILDMFTIKNDDIKPYVNFLQEHYKSKSFLDMVHHVENGHHVTTTMSIVTF